MDEQLPPTNVCPTDVAAAGGSATVLVGVLCFVLAAAFVLERLIRTVVGVQTTARASATTNAGGVPVQTRPAPRAPPPHPSEERLSTNNAKVAAEVVSALERQAAEAESSESDDESPVDIDELRRQVAKRVSPDMRPATNLCSPRKRVTGGLRGFTNSRPLHFEAVFDRTTLRDPTDFWLAKFALTHREEFENLVAETETELPAFVQDPGAPLDLLRSDVGALKSSLARMTRQQRTRAETRSEHAWVAPTPVKQPQEQHTNASASPPVSPVLNLEAVDDQVARKMPLVDSAGPAAFAQPAC